MSDSPRTPLLPPPGRRILDLYASFTRILVYALLVVSAASVVGMVLLVTADVILRAFGSPLKGAYDLVSFGGALAIAGALPYTTACKGHVAIEYFFLKLNRAGRIAVDTLSRLVVIALFALLAWRCVVYAGSLKAAGQVSPTLRFPEYWIVYLISLCCVVVGLVKIYHLLQPGKTLIKP